MNVNSILDRVLKLREEVRVINELLEYNSDNIDKCIELNKIRTDKNKELMELSNINLCVRLGDFLNELSNLTGKSISSFDIKVSTNVVFVGDNVEKMTKIFKDYEDRNLIKLEISYGNDIKFFKYFPFGNKSFQTTEELLMNHCSLVSRKLVNNDIKEWVLDRDIENIALCFDISIFEHLNSELCYPCDLFLNVLKNCVNSLDNVKMGTICKK